MVRVEHLALSTGTPAVVARPDGAPTRGLVLWPDIFGNRPLFDDHAARLADDHGWVVCVVEPFPGREDLPLDERFAAMPHLDDAAKLADLEAAIDACGVAHVGAMGFCMGGMYAMKSLASPRIDRAVSFYGMIRVPPDWDGPGQGNAIDVVATRPGDLLGVYGTEDPWCPNEQVAELEALGAHLAVYPGADHGWAQDPGRDNYREVDAPDAWRRAEAFLADGSLDPT